MENISGKVNELNNIRKLATIAIIRDIQSIDGADNIELVFVRGWHCVVQKGEYKIGDMCIYCEVDSVMPDGLALELAEEYHSLNKKMTKADEDEIETIKIRIAEIIKQNTRPEFEFLRQVKFRIKTRRILGEYSQGICFPLSILNNLGTFNPTLDGKLLFLSNFMSNYKNAILIEENSDVTDLLGVTQYVEPDPATLGAGNGDEKSYQRLDMLISDEERIENLFKKYERLRQYRYIKTEKLEGTAFTCYLKKGKFGVLGRTMEFDKPEEGIGYFDMNAFWKVTLKYKFEDKMRKYANDHNITDDFNWQGELIGEGIQKNIYKLHGQEVRFYNIFNITKQEYLPYEEFLEVMKEVDLKTVPIINDDYELPENYNDLLLEADNTITTMPGSTHLIEGFVYVVKGKVPVTARLLRANFNRISFKAKSRTYKK